ncbi:conserved protein of unknown function [Shewanella benthica]|uniref:Uncharacterized protein n=1 Tax=Shewanella benthica TaxID=43661 RepID=A0A330M386_9GAMM|nr:hypothetical protein [Shewanella benthica]SQH74177.1 conserved protein of unknown function [Shewanella benthica]
MVGLDSLYAMLARPTQRSIERKRLMVEETNNSASIAADDHEPPQSQLPQSLNRRKSPQDRRRGDRRGAPASKEEREREGATNRDLAEHEAVNSPLPRIDIDI